MNMALYVAQTPGPVFHAFDPYNDGVELGTGNHNPQNELGAAWS